MKCFHNALWRRNDCFRNAGGGRGGNRRSHWTWRAGRSRRGRSVRARGRTLVAGVTRLTIWRAFAALIIAQNADGSLRHFDRLGYIVVGTSLVALMAMYFVQKQVARNTGKNP